VLRRCVSSANLKNEEAMARTGPLRHEKEKLFREGTSEDCGGTFLRNVQKDMPSDVASQTRRQESSITPLLKPQISQDIRSV
jgi:hypothetical protein